MSPRALHKTVAAVLGCTLFVCGCGAESDGDSAASGGAAGAGGGGSGGTISTGGVGGATGGAGGAAGGAAGAAGSGGTMPSGGAGGTGGDDCNTTAECKQKYGAGASDCVNSQGPNSICMCGSSPCAAGGTGGTGGSAGTGGAPSLAGRIAVSADGNFHDRDDIGATPVTLAIFARAGLQTKLVHYDHSSHVAQDDADQHADMIVSTTGRLTEFGFNTTVFFDDQKQLNAAVANLAKVINASSASDPLMFIVAGPFEVAWQGLNQADANKRQYVTLLSHSTWNEDHEHVATEHTKDELLADFSTVKFVKISDQNANAFKSAPSAWDWMNGAGANLAWVRGRMPQAEYAEGDNSDAGMAFYLVTGNQKASMTDIKTFFGQ